MTFPAVYRQKGNSQATIYLFFTQSFGYQIGKIPDKSANLTILVKVRENLPRSRSLIDELTGRQQPTDPSKIAHESTKMLRMRRLKEQRRFRSKERESPQARGGKRLARVYAYTAAKVVGKRGCKKSGARKRPQEERWRR